jgi:lipopolysaccharide export system protein LptC
MPLLNPVHERFNLTFSSIQTDASEKPQMLNPRFQGLDTSNQPYYITADTATQASENIVLLDNVNGDITLNDGGWVSITAQTGTIFTEKDELLLERDVHLVMGDGNEFISDKAILYMKESVIEGDQPIKGQGPSGTIDAGGFRVEQGGKKILFNKRVKLIIYPDTRG